MRLNLSALAFVLALGVWSPAMAACPVLARGQSAPPDAVPGTVYWPPWRVGVDALTARLRRTDVSRTRLVFLGDSIVQGWSPQIFRQFYGHREVINLGTGGDMTQGMLWRLENGHWPANLRPELIVLLIGTNNIFNNSSPEAVTLGVSAVISKLQQLSPGSRILLLGILPRGETVNDPLRSVVIQANQLIARCADNRRVFYSDPGQMMVDGEGRLEDYVAFDRLHPTMVGYAIISAVIESVIQSILRR